MRDTGRDVRHFSVDVAGFRKNCNSIRGHWKLIRDPATGQPFKTKKKAIAFIDQLLADNVVVLPVGECDNFSRILGCMGHKVVEVGPRSPEQGLGLDWTGTGNGPRSEP